MKYNFRNPIFNRTGTIDCEIDHPQYGWIPFTASPDDSEEYGRELYNLLIDRVDVAPAILPTNDELAANIRAERDRLLVSSDWTQLPDVPVATAAEWSAYRQQLRNITDQDTFPASVTWPVPPS